LGDRLAEGSALGIGHGIVRRERREDGALTANARWPPRRPMRDDRSGESPQRAAGRTERRQSRDQVGQQILAQILALIWRQAEPTDEPCGRDVGFVELDETAP